MQLTANTLPEYSTAAQLRDDLNETMRSVKDTLAMSFQQLNLTLASMNNTLRNMAPTINTGASFTNMMPSGSNLMLGSMSQPMAGYLANAGMLDLAGFSPKPFNVSSMEFYRQREEELRYRSAPYALGVGMDITNAAGMYGGYKIGGALVKHYGIGKAGGLIGGVKSFAAVTGAGLAAQMAVGAITGTAEQEMENYTQDAAMFRRAGARFSGGPMSYQSSLAMSSWLNTSGNRERYSTEWDQTRLGTEGYRDLASIGLSSGLFHGNNIGQLKKQIEGAAQVVRFLAGVMGSNDVKEAIQAIVQLKNLGFNPIGNTDIARNLGRSAFGLGGIAGISGAQMMNFGMNIGSNVQNSLGVNGMLGMRYGMHGYVNAQMLERSGILNAADMGLLGGAEGAAQRYAMGMANAAKNPALGGMLTAALMGPNGNLSRTGAIQGGYFGMMGVAAENILSPGRFAMWQVNQPNMQRQLSSIHSDSDPMLGMIQSAISPMIEASGAKGRQERTALSAMYISQLTGTDLQTAKMIATMAEYPEYTRRRQALENANVIAGDRAELRSRYTIGSRFGRLGESIARPFSDLYAGFTESVHDVSRWVDSITGESAVTRRAEFDQLKVQGINWEDLKGSTRFGSNKFGSKEPTKELLDEYTSWKPLSAEARAMADQYEAYKRHNTYGSYYDAFKSAGSSKIYDLAGELGLSIGDIGKEYKRSKFYGTVGGGLEFARSLVNGRTVDEGLLTQFGAAVENSYTESDKLKKILNMQGYDFSGTSAIQGERALGIGSKDIAALSKHSDSVFESLSKGIIAMRGGTNSPTAKKNVEAQLAEAMKGLTGSEEKVVRQLLKTVDLDSFKDLDSMEKIRDKVRGIVGNAANSLKDARFDFTAQNIWQLDDTSASVLKKGLDAGGDDLVEALKKIDLSKSPGLKAFKEDYGRINDTIKRYKPGTVIGSLGKEDQDKISAAYGFDIQKDHQKLTIKELGDKAISNALNLSQAVGTEKFISENKDISSTFVRVNDKNAVAVVILKTDGEKVYDMNSYMRVQGLKTLSPTGKATAVGGNPGSTKAPDKKEEQDAGRVNPDGGER